MNNIINLREYWTSPNKQNFYYKDDDYNEAEDDEDGWDCDEDGHAHKSNHRSKQTYCLFCDITLVKKRINGKTVYVDPKELEKLKQWNAMSTQHGQDDRLTINSNLSSVDESEEA